MQDHQVQESIAQDDGQCLWPRAVRELCGFVVSQRFRILSGMQDSSEEGQLPRADVRGPDGGEGGEHTEAHPAGLQQEGGGLRHVERVQRLPGGDRDDNLQPGEQHRRDGDQQEDRAVQEGQQGSDREEQVEARPERVRAGGDAGAGEAEGRRAEAGAGARGGRGQEEEDPREGGSHRRAHVLRGQRQEHRQVVRQRDPVVQQEGGQVGLAGASHPVQHGHQVRRPGQSELPVGAEGGGGPALRLLADSPTDRRPVAARLAGAAVPRIRQPHTQRVPDRASWRIQGARRVSAGAAGGDVGLVPQSFAAPGGLRSHMTASSIDTSPRDDQDGPASIVLSRSSRSVGAGDWCHSERRVIAPCDARQRRRIDNFPLADYRLG